MKSESRNCENAHVAAEHLAEEVDRLQAHGGRELIVEAGVAGPVHDHALQAVQVQPLLGELLDERPGPAVLDHPANLRGQLGPLVQLPLVRQPQERLVGHRAPEEVREPGRQFMIGQLLLRTARAARRKAEEPWRTQDDAECFSQAHFQGIGVFACDRPVIDEPFQLGRGQRATIGPRGESAQDFAGIRLLVKPVVGKQDVGMRPGRPGLQIRTLDLDPLDFQERRR